MVKSYGNNGGLVMVPNPYWQQAWNKTLTLTEVDRPIAQTSDVSYHNYQQGQYDINQCLQTSIHSRAARMTSTKCQR